MGRRTIHLAHVIADGPWKKIHGRDGPASRSAPVVGDWEFDKLVNSAHQHNAPPPHYHGSVSEKLQMGGAEGKSLKSCVDELCLISNEQSAHEE